jgi:F0F1-type ATP synthase membrane subunit b/b'
MIFQAINLTILLLIVYFFSRKKLHAYFKKQREDLSQEIEQAEKDFRMMKLEFEEISSKVEDLDGQILAIKQNATEALKYECEKYERDTELLVKRMLSDTELKIQQAASRAKQDFKEELIEAAFADARSELQSYVAKSDPKWIEGVLAADEKPIERKNYAS